jgi:hypothetical protein
LKWYGIFCVFFFIEFHFIHSDGLQICKDLLKDVTEMLHKEPESTMMKDILASVYFWQFILQYCVAIDQTEEKETCNYESEQEESVNFDSTPQLKKVSFR